MCLHFPDMRGVYNLKQQPLFSRYAHITITYVYYMGMCIWAYNDYIQMIFGQIQHNNNNKGSQSYRWV